MLLTVYGRQHPITAVGDRIDVKDAYFAPAAGRPATSTRYRACRRPLRHRRPPPGHRRCRTSGVYVERGEIQSRGPWLEPLPMAALDKWETTDGSDRIYDAGDIRIFDIGGLTGARLSSATPC